MDGNITTEEDNETNMAKRISIKDIYSHAGNAKGDEALVMLKDKEDRKEAAVAAAAAKKDQAKDKGAKDTFALVLTGSEILTRLEQLGPFLAVAGTSIPQAPPLPQIPFAPVTREKENIPNLQIEGLRKKILPIFDPVFPYPTDASAYAKVIVAYAESGV